MPKLDVALRYTASFRTQASINFLAKLPIHVIRAILLDIFYLSQTDQEKEEGFGNIGVLFTG